MFSSNRNTTTRLTCGFKVNTNSPEWHKSMMKILKKIKGGSFWIDQEGMAYVTGQGDLNKLLKLMGSKRGKNASMAFVKSGTYHPHHHHDHNCYHNYHQQPSNYLGQSMPFWQADMSYLPATTMQPYYHQYPYSGGYNNNYGYY